MCMNSETVEALHAVTSELKACNDDRDHWNTAFLNRGLGGGGGGNGSGGGKIELTGLPMNLEVSQAEAELIFNNRRTAIEAKLKELGWSKTTRVDSPANGETK